MPRPVPNLPYDAALWLLTTLEGIAESMLDSEVLEGRLPDDADFDQVVRSLEQLQGGLYQGALSKGRTIRFIPERAAVYRSLASMLEGQKANQIGIPANFFLLDIAYAYDGERNAAPLDVQGYLDAVTLCNALARLSDYASAGDRILHFVVRPDAKFRVLLDYAASDLKPTTEITAFVQDFLDSEIHRQEKYDIARDGLAEIAKKNGNITVGMLLSEFDVFLRNARASYALLVSKFSIASIQKEIDKQNLEDALRLNKTFSEIQNQLLAIPAALLLAGSAIDAKASFKNVSILLGVAIFSALMWMLVRNQKNSIRAIRTELHIRRDNLNAQPDALSERYVATFDALDNRTNNQLNILNVVALLVFLVFAVVLYAFLDSLDFETIFERFGI